MFFFLTFDLLPISQFELSPFLKKGLKIGDITPQHLYQQLANPALQPRHREMLVTILKLQGAGGVVGPSPRVLSPVAPHPMFQQQQQQQQLRVSPLPPNGESEKQRTDAM